MAYNTFLPSSSSQQSSLFNFGGTSSPKSKGEAMPHPQESPADSTTPSLPPSGGGDKKSKKKKSSIKRPLLEPPKTTQRGEIVRRAAESRLEEEKESLRRQLEERRLKHEAYLEKKLKAKGENADDDDKKKTVELKKSIPKWATLNRARNGVKGSSLERPKVMDVLLEVFETEGGANSSVSAVVLKDALKTYFPSNFKRVYGSTIKKAIEKGLIKQVRGSFKLLQRPGGSSRTADGVHSSKKASLESVLPLVFTWVCEPKEASAVMIKKYFELYYPSLASDAKGFKKALDNGVAKGQLERLTGKGASGTFSLVDGAPKTGTRFEDPIEDAIIAMNEPKDASIPALRIYLDTYHGEFGVKARPHILKQALNRLLQKGHLQRVSGKGFSGTLRLSYPYYPSPKDLWGNEEEESSSSMKEEPKTKHKKIVVEANKPTGGSRARKSLKSSSNKKKQ